MTITANIDIRNQQVARRFRLHRVMAVVAAFFVRIVRGMREDRMRKKQRRELHRFDPPGHIAVNPGHGVTIDARASFEQVLRHFECFGPSFGRNVSRSVRDSRCPGRRTRCETASGSEPSNRAL